MTERVYHCDAYCSELPARIASREFRDGRWLLRLDSTIFRPEGGGQPADGGTINGIPLLALEEDGDDIVHVVGGDPGGGDARLRLDFERRFDHMQQHTAQHLLSQVLVRGLQAPTLSFAIGPEHSSIEIGRPAVSEDEVRALEAECARLVFAALPVRVFESDDPSSLHLRKAPKTQGRIRVVEIEGFDAQACGGTHMHNTSEVGKFTIYRIDNKGKNNKRFYVRLDPG